MWQYFFISLLLALKVNANLFMPEIYDEAQHIAKFVADIFLTDCNVCQSLWVIRKENDLTCNIFLKNIAVTLPETGLFSYKIDSNATPIQGGDYPRYKPEMIVIFLSDSDYDSVEDVLYAMEELPYWNVRGKYILVITGVDSSIQEQDWIEKYFRLFWTEQILRVLICFWQQYMKVYSYNPFIENYGTESTNSTYLSEILAHKIQNMNGHPIKLYYYDTILGRRNTKTENGKWVGYDGLFHETVAETLNASLEVHALSTDLPYDLIKTADMNTPYSDYLKLLSELYDFDVVLTVGNIYSDNNYDTVFVPERNDLFIIVPLAEKIPEYLYIFLIVPVDVWCAIICSLVCVSGVLICIQKYDSKKLDPVRVFMDNCRLLLNESIPDIARNPQEHFLVLLWLSLCIVLATLFQSVLTSALLVPKFYPEINTLEDLYRTNLSIWVSLLNYVHLKELISDNNDPFIKRMRVVPRELTLIGEDLEWIENYRHNSGVIITEEQVELFKLGFNMKPQFHVIEKGILPCVIGYTVPSNKLYFNELQIVLDRITEAGIKMHWRKFNYGMQIIQINATNTSEENNDEVKSVSLKHMQSVFMLLLAGYCLAALSFGIELLLNSIKKYFNNKHK